MTLTLTPEAEQLDRVHGLLCRFPKLTPAERALIFHAIDTAPQGRAGWLAARHIDMASGERLRPCPLAMYAGWAVTPTRDQIIAALNYAAGALA